MSHNPNNNPENTPLKKPGRLQTPGGKDPPFKKRKAKPKRGVKKK